MKYVLIVGRNIELEEHLAELTAKVNQCKYEMETIQETHKQELAEMEGEGEYKISVLLRQLRSNNIDMDTDGNMGDLEQRVLLQNRELERMDTLQSELDEYKRECEDLRERLQEKMSQSSETYRTPEKKAKKNNMKQEYMPMELTDSDEESIVPNDSTDKDPDFRVTPMYKRLQLSKVCLFMLIQYYICRYLLIIKYIICVFIILTVSSKTSCNISRG